MTYTRVIGIDPSGGPKPVAQAILGIKNMDWYVSSCSMDYPANPFPGCRPKTLYVIEGGYMMATRASAALQFQRGALAAIAKCFGFDVVLVPPSSWRKNATGSGKKDLKAERAFAEELTGLDGLTDDEVAAICIAWWGYSMVKCDVELDLI